MTLISMTQMCDGRPTGATQACRQMLSTATSLRQPLGYGITPCAQKVPHNSSGQVILDTAHMLPGTSISAVVMQAHATALTRVMPAMTWGLNMAQLWRPSVLTIGLWPGATFDVVNREYVAMVLNMAYASNLTGADVVAATAEEAVGFLNAGIVLLRLILGVKTLSLAILRQPAPHHSATSDKMQCTKMLSTPAILARTKLCLAPAIQSP